MKPRYVVAVCGASGSLYAIRLLSALLERPVSVYLVVSRAGKLVMEHEVGYSGDDMIDFLKERGCRFHEEAELNVYGDDDFFAPPASGSFRHRGMVVAPCTMGTLGAISAGTGSNLIHRAADVCLKERRPLILMTRETPLNRIHLQNMLTATDAGAIVLPCSPSFYGGADTVEALVDTVTARVLDQLHIPQRMVSEWGVER